MRALGYELTGPGLAVAARLSNALVASNRPSKPLHRFHAISAVAPRFVHRSVHTLRNWAELTGSPRWRYIGSTNRGTRSVAAQDPRDSPRAPIWQAMPTLHG